ncbi:hypothetical protein D1007_46486 [Hordeum vulgare]|nr:hypothetical protein D1007_46486 [Hordeum vulgare]
MLAPRKHGTESPLAHPDSAGGKSEAPVSHPSMGGPAAPTVGHCLAGGEEEERGRQAKATPDALSALPNTLPPADEEGETREATSQALVAEPPIPQSVLRRSWKRCCPRGMLWRPLSQLMRQCPQFPSNLWSLCPSWHCLPDDTARDSTRGSPGGDPYDFDICLGRPEQGLRCLGKVAVVMAEGEKEAKAACAARVEALKEVESARAARDEFQDVLAYFKNCNDLLNHEQAKSAQLEHELEKSHQACRDLRYSKGEIEVTHDKLKRDFEVLLLECKNVKGELVKTSKIYEELQSTHEKSLIATYSSHIVDDTCTSNPISFEVSTLKENVELHAQLDLLTSNYGKLEENHVMLTSSHADLLTSHNVQKLAHEAIITKETSSEPHVDNGTTSSQSTIFPCASPRNSSTHNVATSCDELLSLPCFSNIEAYTSSSTCIDTNRAEEIEELKAQVTSLKKYLEQCHEGMSTLNNVLCEQTSPNDKNDVGVNSNKNKRGLEQVKNPAKIICFKCKVKGHHVRSCPSKTKSQSHKQQGKRSQNQSHIQLQVEERPLRNKTQVNTPRGTTRDALDARLPYKEGVEIM